MVNFDQQIDGKNIIAYSSVKRPGQPAEIKIILEDGTIVEQVGE